MAEPTNVNISEMFSELNVYQIPKYQRQYKWGREQCLDLWEDIMKVVRKEIGTHYLGTIILELDEETVNVTNRNFYRVVDGQQRLTSLSLLLLAIEKVSNDLYSGDEEISEEILDRISHLLRFKTKKEQSVWGRTTRLQLQNVDDLVYLQLASRGEMLKKYSASNIFVAFDAFETKLKAELSNYSTESSRKLFLTNLTDIIFARLRLIKIVTDDKTEIHSIFESLNNRGVQLEQIDLIKNYFMMQTGDDPEFYEKYWMGLVSDEWWASGKSLIKASDTRLSNCFYWFLRSFPYYGKEHTALPSLKRTYDDMYKDFVYYIDSLKNRKNFTNKQALAYLFDSFLSVTSQYKQLHDNLQKKKTPFVITRKNSEEEVKKQRLEEFVDRVGYNGYSWAVIIWLIRNENQLATKDYCDIIHIFETFIVRKRISRPSNILGAVTHFIDKISVVDIGDAKEALIKRISETMNTSDFGIPQDEEIIKSLVENPINESTTKLARTLLYALEETHEKRSFKAKKRLVRAIEDSEGKIHIPIEIEHILPQDWRTHWNLPAGSTLNDQETRNNHVNNIGNLILLSSETNNKVKNYNFDFKIKEYVCDIDDINIVGDFMAEGHLIWDENSIKARALKIAKNVVKIWNLEFIPEGLVIDTSISKVETIDNIAGRMLRAGQTDIFFLTEEDIWESGKFGLGDDTKNVIIFDKNNKPYTNLRELFSENLLKGYKEKKNYWEKIFVDRIEDSSYTVKEFLSSHAKDLDENLS